jgi:hypothetical protein
MRDIRYKWNEGPNSVGVSNEVSLPQFKVLGHRQRAMEISLTTGICRTNTETNQIFMFLLFMISINSIPYFRFKRFLYSRLSVSLISLWFHTIKFAM